MGGLLGNLFKKKSKSPDKEDSFKSLPNKSNRLHSSNSPNASSKTISNLKSYPQPLWAQATAPNVSPSRGPRLPLSHSIGNSGGSTYSKDTMHGPRKIRPRSADEERSSPQRRRVESMGDLANGMNRMNMQQQVQPNKSPTRPPLQQQQSTSPSFRRPLPSPPQIPAKPTVLNRNSTSIYPQAFPTPPRPTPPPLRGSQSDPFVQTTSPKSKVLPTNQPNDLFSPVFPGAFPKNDSSPPPPPPRANLRPNIPTNSRPSPVTIQGSPCSSNEATSGSIFSTYSPPLDSNSRNKQSQSHIYGPNYLSNPLAPIRRYTDTAPLNLRRTSVGVPSNSSPNSISSTSQQHNNNNSPRNNNTSPRNKNTSPRNNLLQSPNASPNSLDHKDRCHGVTTTSKRCTRIVNGPSSPKATGVIAFPATLDVLDDLLRRTACIPDGEEEGGTDSQPVARFCFQHSKSSMQERGCFINGKGVGKWIEFDGTFFFFSFDFFLSLFRLTNTFVLLDWVFGDLPIATKILLRHEMTRPVSTKDQEGYLYVYEMVERKSTKHRDDFITGTTLLKIGRSKQPVARLAQWRNQCTAREPIVRNIFPRFITNSPTTTATTSNSAGLSGALQFSERGLKYSHRWERLVLIEVAGRAAAEAEIRREGIMSMMMSSNYNDTRGGDIDGRVRSKCSCGKSHLELFELAEFSYDSYVIEAIERWGKYVEILG